MVGSEGSISGASGEDGVLIVYRTRRGPDEGLMSTKGMAGKAKGGACRVVVEWRWGRWRCVWSCEGCRASRSRQWERGKERKLTSRRTGVEFTSFAPALQLPSARIKCSPLSRSVRRSGWSAVSSLSSWQMLRENRARGEGA